MRTTRGGSHAMEYQFIRVVERFEGQVTEITIGPPPGNLITARLAAELREEIRRHSAGGADVRHRKAVVIAGDGKHFSYGASVDEHRPEQMRKVLPPFHRFIGELLACPVPTVAKVRGHCLGGGFEIALACSMIVAAEDAGFGLPEIKLGAFPPVASLLLPRKLAGNMASRMILSGESVVAGELLRHGLVNLTAPADALDSAVDAWIEKELLPKSASSLRHACAAAHAGIVQHYATHIDEMERRYLDSLLRTHDAVEGVDAFLARRPPDWKDA